MYSCVTAGALLGLTCYLVRVEVDIAPGLPVFDIVGMGAGTPARESRERVRVALHSLGIRMPASRITVSFSPADVPKRGFVPDLPVAIGILICLGQLRQEDLEDTLISGELGLSGEVRTVRRGMMLLAETAAKEGIRTIIVPEENTAEGAIAADGTLTTGSKEVAEEVHDSEEAQSAVKKKEQRLKVIGVRNLEDCIRYLKTEREQRDAVIAPAVSRLKERIRDDMETGPDFSDVHGQREARDPSTTFRGREYGSDRDLQRRRIAGQERSADHETSISCAASHGHRRGADRRRGVSDAWPHFSGPQRRPLSR